MNCEELLQYLSDYVDQDLNEDLRADAEEHLRTCVNCHVMLDTTQQMIFLYRKGKREGIPAQRRTVLYNQLLGALSQRKP
jgi:heterodisulfide reductase subunit B